jgi:AraC-like DNA-binding protein
MDCRENLVLKRHRLEAGESWSFRKEALWFTHAFKGNGRCTAGASMESVEAGEWLVVHAGRGIRLMAGADEGFGFGWFSVQVEQLFPLFANAELFLLQNVSTRFTGPRRLGSGSVLGEAMAALLVGLPEVPNLDHRSRLLRVVATILTPEIEQERGVVELRSDRGEEHFRLVLAQLSEDDMLNLSVDGLAERFGCSRRHLNRLFHQYTGMSVAAMRMEMRLLKAESLLRDPDAKVIHVAGECGFSHLSQFNSCFKRRFGDTPGRWRRRTMEEATVLVGGGFKREVDGDELEHSGLVAAGGNGHSFG